MQPAQDWRERPTVPAKEAFAILGVSTGAGYLMMQRGDIPFIPLGPKLRRVSTAWLKRQVDGEPGAARRDRD